MQSEYDRIGSRIQQALSDTTFACSSLTSLRGGTTSYAFLCDLIQPYSPGAGDPVEKAIIKHAADHLSCSPDFSLSSSRCGFEASMLAALQGGTRHGHCFNHPVMSTPRLYHLNEAQSVQIIEYVPNTVTVKEALRTLTPSQAASIGHSIGSWLRSFHDWTSESKQTKLRDAIAKNKDMKALKWKVTWEQATQVLERFPNILAKWGKGLWEEIKDSKKKDATVNDGEEIGIIHGDFWTGNILMTDYSTDQLHVIDFELAHVSYRAIDIGQLIGDLLEMAHFNPSLAPSVIALINSFIAGYEKVKEDMAFQIAIYAGVHMINWWSRGSKGESKEGEKLLHKALEILARAWRKDRVWLRENEAFCGLFES
ncbi:hypothetical protein DM02DRAFT_623090 [Periconia macrospinosa]|uniref:Aminoglycoside phosphotransferase domain-containing protein n=1 Tax=Periconia macrospinosa TaxID=97972 RepID=A0A2V1EBE7_9PLEO|nr:hypothetical protein DM02DRAFT_623090 [Periconia macrospinosa]